MKFQTISRAFRARPVVAAKPLRTVQPRSVVCYSSGSEPSTINIKMQGLNFKLSDSIKTYANDKLMKALKPFEAEVKEVDVRFELHDKNHGQVHGAKQKIELVIYTIHNGTVVLSETEEELYAAIDLLLDKLKIKMRKVKDLGVARGKWPGRAGPRGLTMDLEEEFIDEDEVLDAAAQSGELGPFKK